MATTSNVQQMYEHEAAEKHLLALAYRNAKQAETVSQTEYWEPIDSIKSIYGTYDKSPVAPDQAEDKNFKVKINDVADKTDEMFALVKKLLTGREDRKCIAYKKSDEKDVETTRKTQDAMLREGNFDHEKSLAALRFIKYHFSGLKVCRQRERTYKTERVTIPVIGVMDPFTQMPVPGTGYTPQDLLMNGYSVEDVASGEAVRAKLADQGLRFQGFADEFAQPDTEGNPIYTQILCTKTVEAWKDIVLGKSIDPRKLGICDMNRTLGRQPSTHEFNYYTIPELSKCYPYNLDYFRQKAEKASADQQFPGTSNVTGDQGGQGSEDYPVYQVIESWMDLDFEHMIAEGKLTEADLQGLAKKFKFPFQEFFVPGKWCMVHNLDRVLMDLYPSYLWDRDEFPYDIESWEPNEDRFCSRGFIHRISSAAAAVNKFRNFVMKNMRRMLNQSRIYAKRLQIDPKEFEKLDDENGTVMVPGSAADLEKDVRFYEPPDATTAGFNMISYFENMISQLGPPAAIVGEGDAETATQADINDQRGQTIVNESFGRFVDMLMRFYRKHLGAMLISVTRGRMIKAAGEDGAAFRETWVQPMDLTDRMEIVPMISFNDLQEERQSQFLIAMTNVFGQFMMPQEVRAIWKVCLRKGGLSTTDIEEVEGSLGSFTDVKQEVDAMLADASVFPKVQMGDPHPLCIAVAGMALQKRLMEYQAVGLQPEPQFIENLMQYIREHEAMFAEQQMMAQLMTPQDGPDGKPKNEPPRESGSKPEAREKGQEASPPDNGMMTAGGLTGMGAV